MRHMVQQTTLHMPPYPTDRNNSCGSMSYECSDSASDSFNVHTSLVWLDPSLSLCMHVNGNNIGNYHVRTHIIQHVEREGSGHTINYIHT